MVSSACKIEAAIGEAEIALATAYIDIRRQAPSPAYRLWAVAFVLPSFS